MRSYRRMYQTSLLMLAENAVCMETDILLYYSVSLLWLKGTSWTALTVSSCISPLAVPVGDVKTIWVFTVFTWDPVGADTAKCKIPCVNISHEYSHCFWVRTTQNRKMQRRKWDENGGNLILQIDVVKKQQTKKL